MPAYRYRAVDFAGRIARGSVAAANEWELAQNLSQSGLELIEARAKKKSAPAQHTRWFQRVAPYALARFATQMTDLLRAGISFPEALRDMSRAVEAPALRDALDDIHRSVSHGSAIAEAFARHPRLFPDVFVAILAAGEKSGDLVVTFTQLARYAEARARTIEQLRRALRYPIFLLLVTVCVIGFMTTMVIPQIVQFLSSIDSDLPLTTRILIASSRIIADYWWLGALVLVAAGGACYFLHRYSESAARGLDRLILRLPFVGPVLHKLALARFAHSFVVLYTSGLGILESLREGAVTLNNRALQADLARAAQEIQSGRALSAALAAVFPSFAAHMLRIGERSGKIGKALDDIAAACDRDVNDATGKLIGAMEPLLTLAIGSILAWIVLAVLGPIYGNLGKLSGGG